MTLTPSNGMSIRQVKSDKYRGKPWTDFTQKCFFSHCFLDLGRQQNGFQCQVRSNKPWIKKRTNPLKRKSLLGTKSCDVLLKLIAGLLMSYSSITIGPTVLRFYANWILHSTIDQYWHWASYFEIANPHLFLFQPISYQNVAFNQV